MRYTYKVFGDLFCANPPRGNGMEYLYDGAAGTPRDLPSANAASANTVRYELRLGVNDPATLTRNYLTADHLSQVRNDLQYPLFLHLRQVLLFVLFWTLAGCLSFSDGAFRQVDGQFFDDRHVTRIIDGSTREQEILEWFGPPISTSISNDRDKLLQYHSVRARRSEVRKFLIRRIYNQKVTQELTVRVSNGVVVDHKYTAQTSEE